MSYSIDGVGKVHYTLVLNDVRYIAKKLLLDNRSEDICGRATRVWEAYREDDLDRVSVIKDLWTSVGVVQEGSQLLELHGRLRALADPGTPQHPTVQTITLGTLFCADVPYVPTTADHDCH
ncbi:hypothetical protein C8J57DRAFT_1491705 [Mycena rebaudengoi]|nr:hypothetical protein C8J57DRAFT_1491705 [Mycena rebaudengoi]